jgi:hypothetical protein
VRSRNGGSIADGTAWAAPWTRILTGSNYTNVLDSRYVNVAGDTMTGLLNIKVNNKTTTIGSQNTNYTHYNTDAAKGHYFNKNLYVDGDIYGGASFNEYVMRVKSGALNCNTQYDAGLSLI